MVESFEARGAAVAALTRAVLHRLKIDEERPSIGQLNDNQRWWRYGQEDFVGLNPKAWRMPPYVPVLGWLDGFPEMAAVRKAFDDDPVLRHRVDTLVGPEFSRQARNFDWLLIEHVIQPIVLATASYDFDDAAFDRIYREFDKGLGAARIHMVEFLPLNGFDSTENEVLLPDGLVLERATDRQMSAAIQHLAVPRMSSNSVNGARVSRFDQWVLTATNAYPVIGGRTVGSPRSADFPRLYERAAVLVAALRLVCGGSVVTTRSMFAQADDEFPLVLNPTAVLTAFDQADNARPTVLFGDALETLLATYTILSMPVVRADRSLQVAIRRLIFAGSRRVDADRLIDLMTCAEALFIKRAALEGPAKAKKIAPATARLLADDLELNSDEHQLEAFMTTLYFARNAEIHGDDEPYPNLHMLDGAPASSLGQVLEDGERVMRRAILKTLAEHDVS